MCANPQTATLVSAVSSRYQGFPESASKRRFRFPGSGRGHVPVSQGCHGFCAVLLRSVIAVCAFCDTLRIVK
jgi:hypothetical protein